MVEQNESGGMTITGPHVEIYRLLATRSAMQLEVKTGMKMSSRYNVFKNVRTEFGITAKSKAEVLRQFEILLLFNGIGKDSEWAKKYTENDIPKE